MISSFKSAVFTEINFDKVKEFINYATLDKDFLLFQPYEIDKMETVYLQTNFKIIAYLKKGLIGDKDYFFSIIPMKEKSI